MTDAEADALAFAMSPAPMTAAQVAWLGAALVLAVLAGWIWMGMD